MINPVAPFYEWYLEFQLFLPQPFKLFLALSLGVWLILSVYTFFWRVH